MQWIFCGRNWTRMHKRRTRDSLSKLRRLVEKWLALLPIDFLELFHEFLANLLHRLVVSRFFDKLQVFVEVYSFNFITTWFCTSSRTFPQCKLWYIRSGLLVLQLRELLINFGVLRVGHWILIRFGAASLDYWGFAHFALAINQIWVHRVGAATLLAAVFNWHLVNLVELDSLNLILQFIMFYLELLILSELDILWYVGVVRRHVIEVDWRVALALACLRLGLPFALA